MFLLPTDTKKNGGCYDNAKRYEGQGRGLKRVRIRDHHRRDYDLYYKFGDMLSRTKVTIPGCPEGYTPLQCYILMDSHGERSGPYECTDYDTLDRVLKGKENVNLQIKMWIETCVLDPLLLMPDEVKTYCSEYPDWVFKSYVNQLNREYFKKHGWVPTFIHKHLDDEKR